jgi:hypothetical protein
MSIVVNMGLYSQTTSIPAIECKNGEKYIAEMLKVDSVKLTFFYSMSAITFNGVTDYIYKFTDADTIKSSLWLPTYKDNNDIVRSFTLMTTEDGTPYVLTWSTPMQYVLIGMKFNIDKTIEVDNNSYVKFVKKVKAKFNYTEYISDITNNNDKLFSSGTGFADSIDILGKRYVEINKDKQIFFITYYDQQKKSYEFEWAYTDAPEIVYSESVAAAVEDNSKINLSMAPNPCINELKICGELAEYSNQFSIDVCDMSGKIIMNAYKGECSAGEFSFSINTRELESGAYNAIINDGKHVYTKRFIVKK